MSEQPPVGDNVSCANCSFSMEKEDRYDQLICTNDDSPEARGDVEATGRCECFKAMDKPPAVHGEGACQLPPEGWECTRGAGHDGPCAAIQFGALPPGALDLNRLYKAMPPVLQRRVSLHDLKRTVDAYNSEESADKDALIAELRASHTREVTDWRDRLDNAWKAAARAKKDDAKKDALIRGLVEALEFYADVSKYPVPKTGGLGELFFDCGDTAKVALRQAEQGGGA